MQKKPYTNNQLFDIIDAKLKESGELPVILDYSLAESLKEKKLKSYMFDLTMDLRFGGSEGIYLCMYADGIVDDTNLHQTIHLGTFKTLFETKEAFRIMAQLGADFIYAGRQFINNNLDDFTWSGYKVSMFKTDGQELPYAYNVSFRDKAIRYVNDFLSEDQAGWCEVFDFAKRTTEKIEKQDVPQEIV